MSGIADMVFEEKGTLVVADFKTDRITSNDTKNQAQRYESQGMAYAEGIEAASGLEVREVIFAFLRTGDEVAIPVDDSTRKRLKIKAKSIV